MICHLESRFDTQGRWDGSTNSSTAPPGPLPGPASVGQRKAREKAVNRRGDRPAGADRVSLFTVKVLPFSRATDRDYISPR